MYYNTHIFEFSEKGALVKLERINKSINIGTEISLQKSRASISKISDVLLHLEPEMYGRVERRVYNKLKGESSNMETLDQVFGLIEEEVQAAINFYEQSGEENRRSDGPPC